MSTNNWIGIVISVVNILMVSWYWYNDKVTRREQQQAAEQQQMTLITPEKLLTVMQESGRYRMSIKAATTQGVNVSFVCEHCGCPFVRPVPSDSIPEPPQSSDFGEVNNRKEVGH